MLIAIVQNNLVVQIIETNENDETQNASAYADWALGAEIPSKVIAADAKTQIGNVVQGV